MTKHVTEQLVCDDCRTPLRQGKQGQSIDDLRDRLAEGGWLSNKARDTDLCPTCIEARHV